jgi:hypothetical protein
MRRDETKERMKKLNQADDAILFIKRMLCMLNDGFARLRPIAQLNPCFPSETQTEDGSHQRQGAGGALAPLNEAATIATGRGCFFLNHYGSNPGRNVLNQGT